MPVLYYVNIFAVLLIVSHYFFRPVINEDINDFLDNVQLAFVHFILIFGIKLIILWSRYDKKPSRFFFLLFLFGWYTIYYFHFSKKMGWLEKYSSRRNHGGENSSVNLNQA